MKERVSEREIEREREREREREKETALGVQWEQAEEQKLRTSGEGEAIVVVCEKRTKLLRRCLLAQDQRDSKIKVKKEMGVHSKMRMIMGKLERKKC
jgi:hypothetical protein